MSKVPELRTDRLLLHRWRDADVAHFAAINADPEVMEFFPSIQSYAETEAMVGRIEACFDEHGFGLWAVEIPEVAPCIGFVGLYPVTFDSHFTPAVEVGWRLGKEWWGSGYATEAGRAALAFGFDEIGLDEIVSFTAVANERSQRVMERLGMTHNSADDFDHPRLAEGHWLRRHVLYRTQAQRGRG